MNITLVKHESPELVVKAFANPENEPDFDLNGLELGGVDDEGNDFECPASDMLDRIRRNGFWGFAATREGEIHVWDGGEVAPDRLMMFLGHEVGHLCEEEIDPNHPAPEEARADLYGVAASEAYKLLIQLRGSECQKSS